MENRFHFLKDKNKVIFDNICDAINNYIINPDVSAFKVRKCLEALIRKIYEKEYSLKKNKCNDNSLYNNLEELYNNKILPENIFRACNYVREIGNKGVHHENVTSVEVEDSIDCFFSICLWYYSKYEHYTNLNEYVGYIPQLGFDTRYAHKLSGKDKIIFENGLDWISELIKKLIIDDKLNGRGIINQVDYISFDEYYEYFLKALQKAANFALPEKNWTTEKSLQLILRVKELAKINYEIGDDYKINKILAYALYEHTHWALLKK